MSLTTEGVLIVIGALFLLIGIVGGGFEASVIKIPTTGKLSRVLSFGVGSVLIIVGVTFLLINQSSDAVARQSQPAAAASQPAAEQDATDQSQPAAASQPAAEEDSADQSQTGPAESKPAADDGKSQ